MGQVQKENSLEAINHFEKKSLNCSFEVKNINDEDPDFFIFEGYASTFDNVDLGDDAVQRGAFVKSLQKDGQVPILWQHSMSEPIGKSIELFEDNIGLFVRAKLPKEDDLVKGRVVPQMKVGSINEMSIGFRILEASTAIRDEKEVRLLDEIQLFEISLVTKAMNPQALVTGFKTALSEGIIAKEDKEEVTSLLKDETSENTSLEYKSVEEVPADVRDIEKYLKSKGLSAKEYKTIISKIKDVVLQRDVADQSTVRDEQLKSLNSDIINLTNYLKGNK